MLITLFFAALAFTLSACVGMGGSLILVPAMSLIWGTKTGVALAGLLLAGNNIAKVIAYRRTLPFWPIAGVLVATSMGALLGAALLVAAPAAYVSAAVVVVIGLSFLTEQKAAATVKRSSGPVVAFLAGLTSGFAGTSGPLKGVALRGLTSDRMNLAGAASAVSLVGDLTKASVYVSASMIDATAWSIAGWAFLLTPMTAMLGFRLNQAIGEHAYKLAFWTVMFGYTARLAFF
jgi:uncharacterized protein